MILYYSLLIFNIFRFWCKIQYIIITIKKKPCIRRCGRTGRAGNKGYAWTFLTPEQGRYAGDVLRAFELAGTPAPAELRQLWETYKEAQEKEGKKVHTGGGFSGKGQ